jgi:hypothetical protein
MKNTHFTKNLHFTPLHCTEIHSLFFTSLHFWKLCHHASNNHHFYLLITFLAFLIRISDFQGKVASPSAGSLFHSLIVLFTKEYLPISVLCSLDPVMNVLLWLCNELFIIFKYSEFKYNVLEIFLEACVAACRIGTEQT